MGHGDNLFHAGRGRVVGQAHVDDVVRGEGVDEDRLSAFADFVNTLDLDDLEDNED